MRYHCSVAFEADSEQTADFIADALKTILNHYKVDGRISPVAPSLDADRVVVHTDGGCHNKNGIGAWAFVAEGEAIGTITQSGHFSGTTNNRMELLAVIKALEALEIGPPVLIRSDSEYVVKGITQWVNNWVKNGWKTYTGKQVVNRDLWERLLKLYRLHDVSFEHVYGHSGVELNERCDQLCTAEMAVGHKKLLAGEPVPVDEEAQTAGGKNADVHHTTDVPCG